MKRKRHASKYLNYLFILAFGSTILYSFSLVPRVTGFATADEEKCTKYFGDGICDDAAADCGPAYIEGESLAMCNECQTQKDGKPGYDCAAAKSKPATGPESAKCTGYFDDKICDDSQADCGSDYKSGTSADHCNECQTEKNGKKGFNCKPKVTTPVPVKPNLNVKSHEIRPDYLYPDDVKTKTGIYGVHVFRSVVCLVPVICDHINFYEIQKDGSIINDTKGRTQQIWEFDIIFLVSNDGKQTYDEFQVELQKLNEDSSSWSKVKSRNVVLTETSREIEFTLYKVLNVKDEPKFRLVVDPKDKIKESNEDDNQYVFNFPIRKILLPPFIGMVQDDNVVSK